MEHPIGYFITPLYGETKHPKGAPKNGSYRIPKGVHETPVFYSERYIVLYSNIPWTIH